MKKSFLLVLLVLIGCMATCSASTLFPSNAPCERPEIEGVDEDGYLLSDEDEFVYADAENGLWVYVSSEMRVEIDRFKANDLDLVWLSAHIWQKEPTGFETFFSNEKKPWDDHMNQETLSRRERLIFSCNSDFFSARLGDIPVGIVIRHGKVISKKTAASRSGIPTLDLMAFYPDGVMKTYGSREYTPDALLEMGVTDTVCFGPILVRDGELKLEYLQNLGHAREPRTALGMIEPGHYVCILTEGRTKDSEGVELSWLGQMMAEEGCVEALNLDGGKTSVMCFMGNKINQTGLPGKDEYARRTTDLLGIGHSEKVTKP
ncbi:MAG: phosphodiester glycosidase family protein [Clostridia bacterium]|nr:phosphodiester glycosidase family protein [Clostridia bacterium]